MIKENFENILKQIPEDVEVVIASKSRTIEEIELAIANGAKIIGENYVKEAEYKQALIKNKVKWHLIGHLQRNKAKNAVKVFDMIETLDSVGLAQILDRECAKINKIMPVLVEVNSGSEPQKSGVLPQNLKDFVEEISTFKNIKSMGLMTMGPELENPQNLRPFFKKTKELFDEIKTNSPQKTDWVYLSMGMSSSYKIAIEEGANMVRIGTAIFGGRTKL